MSDASLLIVDDEKNLLASMHRLLSDEEYRLVTAKNGKEGLRLAVEMSPTVIVVDYQMPQMNGLEFLKAIKAVMPKVPVIVMTAHGDKNTSVSFLKEGAFRYLEKPFPGDEFRLAVSDAISHVRLIEENEKLHRVVLLNQEFPEIVGQSRLMHDLFDLVERVAKTDMTVLIQGESGTGKELIATAIHEKSLRAGKPFIRINCAVIPEALIESELFGYEKGAFTGAEETKLGRFDLAQQGTLFFDEIGETTPNLQVKLLRVLQEKEFERVGGNKTIKADVRIIAATNRNLESMVKAKTFREDLFYRLSHFPIAMPPLRKRGDDVILLAKHFLVSMAQEYNKAVSGFSPEALEAIKNYSWKGNVRELQNVIARAVILCNSAVIPRHLLPIDSDKEDRVVGRALEEHLTEEQLVKRYAKAVYERCGFNKKETARLLKINFRTLVARLK